MPLLPGSGHICALCLIISGQRRLNWREQAKPFPAPHCLETRVRDNAPVRNLYGSMRSSGNCDFDQS
jgi:hypothetical protein